MNFLPPAAPPSGATFLTVCSSSQPLPPPPGCDMELMEDVKGLTAGVSSRKRGKRRYFWEYSEQLTPSKQERMLKPSEWDRHTLPSNLYQKNGPLHGIHSTSAYCWTLPVWF